MGLLAALHAVILFIMCCWCDMEQCCQSWQAWDASLGQCYTLDIDRHNLSNHLSDHVAAPRGSCQHHLVQCSL